MNTAELYLEDVRLQARKTRQLADRALDQLSEGDFFATLAEGENSVALIVKHMAGNMRSRWTDD